MKLSELISTIGDQNVKFQLLDNDLISADYDRRKGTKITFGSDAAVLPDGIKDVGIIVWAPRDRFKEIVDRL
jgi:L-rhamnose isomerase